MDKTLALSLVTLLPVSGSDVESEAPFPLSPLTSLGLFSLRLDPLATTPCWGAQLLGGLESSFSPPPGNLGYFCINSHRVWGEWDLIGKEQTFSCFLSSSTQLPLVWLLKSQAPFSAIQQSGFPPVGVAFGVLQRGIIPAKLGFHTAPFSAATGVIQGSPSPFSWAWEGSRGPRAPLPGFCPLTLHQALYCWTSVGWTCPCSSRVRKGTLEGFLEEAVEREGSGGGGRGQQQAFAHWGGGWEPMSTQTRFCNDLFRNKCT